MGEKYLEGLCNELLLEILEYLDVYQLFMTFYGLNRRFNGLIQQCNYHVCFRHSKNEDKIWRLIASTINLSQVREMSYYYNHFIDRRFLISKCPNLRSLTLHRVNGFYVQVLLDDIPLVNQIKHIRIEYPRFLCSSNEVFLRDFSLKKYHRQLNSLVTGLFDLPINPYSVSDIPIIFPKLRRLSLDECYWRSSIIEFLQNNTPNLRSLHIRTEKYTPERFSLSKYVLKNIIELDINLNIHSIDIKYLGQMFPSLRRLNIEWNICRKCPFIDGFQWEKIIEKNWPLMRHLTFDFRYAKLNEQFLNTFYKNKYWLSKKIDPISWEPHLCSNYLLKIDFK
jgi:hypothetical protein